MRLSTLVASVLVLWYRLMDLYLPTITVVLMPFASTPPLSTIIC